MEQVEPDDMVHCIEILTGGYVQSFVDFFNLMHPNSGGTESEDDGENCCSIMNRNKDKNKETIKNGDDNQNEENEESKDDESGEIDLNLIRDKLTNAEKARRLGAPNAVYENYRELAAYFCSNNDSKTGTYFYEKCLKISQLVNDVDEEKNANFQLGLAFQDLSSGAEKAITYHERHLELSIKTEDAEGKRKAREQLAIVYERRATELEASKLQSGIVKAVSYLEKCVQIATEEKQPQAKAKANFRLGCAFNKIGKPDRAIVALTQNLEHCRKTEDIRGQGEACANLADAYLQGEEKANKAIEYLEQSLTIAQQINDTKMQAYACRSIGSVHTRCGEYDKAVPYFEQNFELVRKADDGSLQDIDKARVLLGIAVKNAKKAQYLNMIKTDFNGLLNWKIST